MSSQASYSYGYGGSAAGEQRQYPPPPAAAQRTQPPPGQGYEYYSHPSIMRSPAQSQCSLAPSEQRDLPDVYGMSAAGTQSQYGNMHPATGGGGDYYQKRHQARSEYSLDGPKSAATLSMYSGYTGRSARTGRSERTGRTGRSRRSERSGNDASEAPAHPEYQQEKGVKNYFMKAKVDQFGTSHESVSKTKFAIAAVLTGAAAYAAKKGVDRYRTTQAAKLMAEMPPATPCLSGSVVGSRYGCGPCSSVGR
ncbi:hypothetical protein H4R18_000161 [Coemansia javaensis]|uniref:Uncharacterized protein n=1 Tax=Coemansia javaensis TaxID=2761396 RepID=A0A9W8HHG0_9FUNG|nr:hypothetical protein H4R18_000161 [Coemansia javaensis]